MYGRRWGDGIHQAVESKENLSIQEETDALSLITYQGLFLLYKKLSGMTGTAQTEKEEFEKTYGLPVITVPTNKPNIRKDLPDLVYQTQYAKLSNIVQECIDIYSIGRPILVGTTTIEASELIASSLNIAKIPYRLLNARPENTTRESEIIAMAGCKNAVTISTNMAGRGTDIILGGNLNYITNNLVIKFFELNKKKSDLIVFRTLAFYLQNYNSRVLTLRSYAVYFKGWNNVFLSIQKLLKPIPKLNLNQGNDSRVRKISELSNYFFYRKNFLKRSVVPNEVKTDSTLIYFFRFCNFLLPITTAKFKVQRKIVTSLGGLHVIGTERHDSRRIDNQLRGRSGRQGDPGSSVFLLSLEDSLLRNFGGEKIRKLYEKAGLPTELPIQAPLLSKSLDSAQRKVERFFYESRRELLEYDKILDVQRTTIYSERMRILKRGADKDLLLDFAYLNIMDLTHWCDFNRKKFPLLSYPRISISDRKIRYPSFLEGQGDTVIEIKFLELIGSSFRFNKHKKKPYLLDWKTINLYTNFETAYEVKKKELENVAEGFSTLIEQQIILYEIDNRWQNHLKSLNLLKESTRWTVYGQLRPLTVYKRRSFDLFIKLLAEIRHSSFRSCLSYNVVISSDERETSD
jgi:preprotein translocase subunit SecA